MSNSAFQRAPSSPVWYDRSSSLVDSETIVQTLLETTEAQAQIHAKTANQRCRLVMAFVMSNDEKLRKRAERIADCCKWPMFFIKNDGSTGLSLQRCRDRLCPVCSYIKSKQSAAAIKESVTKMASTRMITLTGCSTNRSLEEMRKHIQTSFRKLRKSDFWKRHVKGGVWALEAKPGRTEGTWNVHLHMLVDGDYIPQDQLSAAWLEATGDSRIVDIRKVHSTEGAAFYVTKYVAKPGDFERMSNDELVQFARGLHSARLFGTFGTLHAIKADEVIEDVVTTNAGTSISAHKLCRLADRNYASAQRAVDLLERVGGMWSCAVARGYGQSDKTLTRPEIHEIATCIVDCVAEVARQNSASSVVTRAIAEPPLLIPEQIVIDDWIMCKVY